MSEEVNDTVQVERDPEAKPDSKSQSNSQSDSQKTKLASPKLLSCITQSIFRAAPRRERLGEHPLADRRDGGLKMGWTKPLGCGVTYGY